MNQLSVSVCVFKRHDTSSSWEQGIIINSDMLIVDMQGKPVKFPVYDYQMREYAGCMIVKEQENGAN